jgi:hypothetical protein
MDPVGGSPLTTAPAAPRSRLTLEPLYTQAALSPPAFFFCTIMHWVLVWIAATPAGALAIAVDPKHLIVANILSETFHAVNVWLIRPERIHHARLWPYRAFCFVIMLPTLAVYGAASQLDVSPGWIVALDAPLLFAPALAGSRFLAALLLVEPVLLRLVFVSRPSLSSLGVALLAGALCVWLYRARSRRVLAVRALEARARADDEMSAQFKEQARELDVAMSLHDGLSGALFAARQKASRIAAPEELLAIGRRAALQVRGVLGGIRMRSAGDLDARRLETLLVAHARLLELRGSVRVVAQRRAPADELLDVRDLAFEALANAASHRGARRFELAVLFAPERTSVVCRGFDGDGARDPGPAVPREARGRGLRNATLRVSSRGGSFTLGETAGGSVLEVTWPAFEPPEEGLFSRLLPDLPVGLLVTVALAAMNRSLSAWLCVASNVPFLFWTSFTLFRGVGRAKARLREAAAARRDAERAPNLTLADRALSDPLDTLETAVVEGRAGDVRETLERLALVLGDVLWALEWRGTADEMVLELDGLGRGRNMAKVPLPGGVESDVLARYAVRAEIRELSRVPAAT